MRRSSYLSIVGYIVTTFINLYYLTDVSDFYGPYDIFMVSVNFYFGGLDFVDVFRFATWLLPQAIILAYCFAYFTNYFRSCIVYFITRSRETAHFLNKIWKHCFRVIICCSLFRGGFSFMVPGVDTGSWLTLLLGAIHYLLFIVFLLVLMVIQFLWTKNINSLPITLICLVVIVFLLASISKGNVETATVMDVVWLSILTGCFLLANTLGLLIIEVRIRNMDF